MIDTSLVISPPSWVREIQTEDGAALLDLSQGMCFSMNPVGAKIWNLFRLRYSLEQITVAVASEFGIPGQQAHDDVVEFAGQLVARGLLRPSEFHQDAGRTSWIVRQIRRITRPNRL
jgi:hypothetical protein